jgi:hypothetical protein
MFLLVIKTIQIGVTRVLYYPDGTHLLGRDRSNAYNHESEPAGASNSAQHTVT